MPKKHKQNVLSIKPATSVPSSLVLRNDSNVSKSVSPTLVSVNERILESRRATNDERLNALRQLPQTSLPPSVRQAINPAVSYPEPQPRNRQSRRRIPGPKPPKSWIAAKLGTFATIQAAERRFSQWSKLDDLPHLPGSDATLAAISLQHISAKAAVENLSNLSPYMLAELPTHQKLLILNYVTKYGTGFRMDVLPTLFPLDTTPQSEIDEVIYLNLANGLGSHATMQSITRSLLLRPNHLSDQINDSDPPDHVPESWDTGMLPSSVVLRTTLRFTNLKHLSLALLPTATDTFSSSLWRDLISLSAHLPTLLSLSLAFWPVPSYHTKASVYRDATRRTESYNPGDITTENGFDATLLRESGREARAILTTLSRNLYCLEWLDLTGCAYWLPIVHAVIPEDDTENGVFFGSSYIRKDYSPVWTTWITLKTIIAHVGWRPDMTFYETDDTSVSDASSTPAEERAVNNLYGNNQRVQSSLQAVSERRRGTPTEAERAASKELQDMETKRLVKLAERQKAQYEAKLKLFRCLRSKTEAFSDAIHNARLRCSMRRIDVQTSEYPTENEKDISLGPWSSVLV